MPNEFDLKSAYSAETYRKKGHAIVDLLADQLAQTLADENQPVVEMTQPDSAYQEIEALMQEFRNREDQDLTELFRHVFRRTIRLHSPRYLGHQISPPLPDTALASMMGDLLNNGMGVFEMGIAGTVMERYVIKSLAQKFGYEDRADGYMTSGGTLGNLTALLAARRAVAKDDVWQDGYKNRLAILVSDQAHYCIDKAARIMGLGEKGVVLIPTNDSFAMQTDALVSRLESARNDGLEVFAVVGSACSTATGAFDDLNTIGQFCQQNGLWFHVDGAHGAATIYSSEFRDRVAGIETADSVTMDFHKLLMTPALATALIFKDGRFAAQNFSQQADYLWEETNQDDSQMEWHDLARRTFECTKSMVGFKVFTLLAMHGDSIFDANVTQLYRSTVEFAELIQMQSDFELATPPQSNIICFRLVAEDQDMDQLNRRIRAELIASGEFYIVQTVLRNQVWLRCTVANPMTKRKHFERLLDSIRRIAKKGLRI